MDLFVDYVAWENEFVGPGHLAGSLFIPECELHSHAELTASSLFFPYSRMRRVGSAVSEVLLTAESWIAHSVSPVS